MELTGELLDDETFDVDTNCNAANNEATVLSQAEHGNGNDIMEDVVEEKETVEAERMDASIQDDGSSAPACNTGRLLEPTPTVHGSPCNTRRLPFLCSISIR